MAKRQVLLTMTPSEEAALSRLIGFLCQTEDVQGGVKYLTRILGKNNSDIDAIGRINAVLSANR